MPKHANTPISNTSLVLLKPILDALDPGGTALADRIGSLSATGFWLPSIRTMLCATRIDHVERHRTAMVACSVTNDADVVLVRHGAHPELLDDVFVDVVVGRARPPLMLWALCCYLDLVGRTWLVPPADGAGPSIGLDRTGLTPTIAPPYPSDDDCSGGLARAARRTVLALREIRGA